MAIDVKWFEHTEPAVQNALGTADQYVQIDPPLFRAFQATEDSALNVAPQGTTYKVLTDQWIVVDSNNDISVYTDTDFQSVYKLKV